MDRLAALFVRHRLWIALGIVAFTALAGFGITRLQIDDRPSSIFTSKDEAFDRFRETITDFGSDDNDCLVVLEADDFFTPEAARILREIDTRLEAVDGVEGAFGLADVLSYEGGLLPGRLLPAPDASPAEFEEARARARAHPLVHNQLLSPDGQTLLHIARLRGTDLPLAKLEPCVLELQSIIGECTAGTGLSARLTGVPPLRVVIFRTIEREQAMFSISGAVLGLLVGIVMFRRLAPVLITVSAAMAAGLWAIGGLGLVGERVNLLTASMPMLIMVIAFTDAVHLMVDILSSRQRGVSAVESSRLAVRHLGIACALTSITTAIGFGSLAVSRIGVIQSFGIAFACAVGLTFIAVVLIVPLLSSCALRVRPGKNIMPQRKWLKHHAERLIRAVVRHAKGIAVIGVVLTALLLYVSLHLIPDNRLTESTPRGNEAADALGHLETAFGGALMLNVVCEWPEGQTIASPEVAEVLLGVKQVLVDHDFAHGPLSPYDFLSLFPGAGPEAERAHLLELIPEELLSRTLRADKHRALVTARVPDRGTLIAEPAYAEMEAELDKIRELHEGFAINLTGTAYIARRNINLIIGDFGLGLLLAAGVIFAVLTIAFRSLRLGALAVFPNAFPLVVAASTLVFLGLNLQVGSAIAFTVCLGIAVDDTIHFIARFRRELEERRDIEEAVVHTFLSVGGALLVTTAVLFAGFGVIFGSTIAVSQLFAAIVCVALVAALFGDLVFLPALLVVFTKPPVKKSQTRSALEER
jgi:uncharacterized protein